MFQRIAIVNRGEAAMRLIHAVRDINAEHRDNPPLVTIALHTSGERSAMFVREADESYDIGPASERPYLDHAKLRGALIDTKADAVWVGWGFVAEDPEFADLCARIGVTFIGPSAEAMRKLGDKIGSKLIAEEVGVPVAPWSRGGVDTLGEALASASEIGYPLMLKATAGGGGRGIRRVDNAEDLEEAYQRTRDEAQRAFGSGVVFLEKMVTGARHVEVQLIADGQGTAWALGVRDCSVQRRNQKIIEESSSPVLTREQADALKASAERLAIAVDYAGAGTVEFLYHPETQSFAFLEVNTRLQVEHPITEITTDVDLVRAQIQIAAGRPLVGSRPIEVGHAIEARLNAEDPDRDFAPAPGYIELLNLPTGPGVRVDTGVAEGDTIPADFDSMIAKVIAYGRTRREAMARLRRAMAQTTVVIQGGATNKSFVLTLLEQPEVTGDWPPDTIGEWADTGWIDRTRAAGGLQGVDNAGLALVAAAIEAYDEEEVVEIAQLLDTARGGRPQAQHTPGRTIELKIGGAVYPVGVFKTGPQDYRVRLSTDGEPTAVSVRYDRLDAHRATLTLGGETHHLVTASHGPVLTIEVDEVAHRVTRDEGGVVRSPAPALVVATPVSAGDEVAAGAPVLVLESMKMETVIPAPFAARVKEVLAIKGAQVETGAALIRLEPILDSDEEQAPAPAASVTLPEVETNGDATQVMAQARTELAAGLLGFDTDPDDAPLSTYLAERDQLPDPTTAIGDELHLLTIFTALTELTRNRPAEQRERTELQVTSDREYLHRYLQSLDVERAGLDESFRERLATVLTFYGVEDLTRTRELEDAVFRIFLATQGLKTDTVQAVLARWQICPLPSPEVAEAARPVLVRLGHATRQRFPVLSDLARSIRFAWFDQADLERERNQVLDAAREQVEALATNPEIADRGQIIAQVAELPEHISRLLGERVQGQLPAYEPMLEVLLTRYYAEYGATDVRSVTGDRALAVATFTLRDQPTFVVSTILTGVELADPAESAPIVDQLEQRPEGHEAVVELYLPWADESDDAADGLRAMLEPLPWITDVQRIVVGLAHPSGRVTYHTFGPLADNGGARRAEINSPEDIVGLIEDERIRGIHPTVGRRLDLWRLQDFDVVRLPAPDEVVLLDCTARSNPDDRRLVALAQVRNLTASYSADGQLEALPQAERVIETCLEAIRRARTSSTDRLDTNHVWVHVWPPIDLPVDAIGALGAKITPLGRGAGIDEVLAHGRMVDPANGGLTPIAIRFYDKPGAGVVAELNAPSQQPLKPRNEYDTKVLRAKSRGLVYPYELSDVLAGPGGTLVEHDLDENGRLVPVDRAPGLNTAGIICAVVTTPTPLYPEGVTRVVLSGDPTRGLGAVAEAECRRIIAALDLADEMGVPLEWFTLSSGARISMDSGTENMDWVGAALRRIVEFTQAGGEINIIVAGINVGAQPYWNAEATMLMHTRGILVMTPDSAMVLTGKQSLDFSGGVSAEDNLGIGGYDRVMGPNGEAQYWAPDLAGAFVILMRHYEHTYVVPGESGPRRADTDDPSDRDVSTAPHGGEFATVGEIWSSNPDRKKAFEIRPVMNAVCDTDHRPLERWPGMGDAQTAVVYDARIGGYPVCVIGIESTPVARSGFPPTDGPDTYTAGTLFPRSSKKVARAINAASGNRPLVVLANLSGFDGSPESMRNLQLEYGAEIGRAIVNFDGPIVFVVISRYHGGAFVVFSKTLNSSMTVLAIEGSYASVIGGAPAAAVVFARDVDKRTAADQRVKDLVTRLAEASPAERNEIAHQLSDVRAEVRAEKISEIAAEFDGVHNIHRAVDVGSVDKVIPAESLRPEIIAAIEAKLARPRARHAAEN